MNAGKWKRRGLSGGAPPGPASGTWRLTVGLWWWGIFTVLAGLVLCVVSFLMVRDEIALDVRQGVAVARVATISAGRGPGIARVDFPADGKPREAAVEQPFFGHALEPGDQSRIDYLPSNPAVARRAGTHDPIGFAVVLDGLVVAAFVSLVRPLRRRGSRRR